MTTAYLARRLALLLPTALLASLVVFTVMRALPGDVAATILSGGGETTHSPEVREALRTELGLDDPLPVQYARWLAAMLDGSFGGDALVDGQPIRSQIARQLPVTGLLALYALGLTLVVWLPLGVLAGWQRGRWPDHLARLAMLPGLATPSFLLALLALLGLLLLLGWSPPFVYAGPLEDPWEHALMVAIPAALLSWEYGAHVLRVARAAVAETLAQPYVLTAVAKGLPERHVVLGHALRNALLPVLHDPRSPVRHAPRRRPHPRVHLRPPRPRPGPRRGRPRPRLPRRPKPHDAPRPRRPPRQPRPRRRLRLARPPRLLHRRTPGGDRMTPHLVIPAQAGIQGLRAGVYS